MSWSTRFRIREYLRGSLWFAPLLGGLVGAIFGPIVDYFNRSLELPAHWQYSPSTASTVLSAIVGAMVGLTGFVVTVSVLVVQMATGTFSARYMRLWYRDRMLKALLAVLVATLVFSFEMLRRVEDTSVPNLGVTISGGLVVVGLVFFLLFLDRSLHRLRPVAVAALAVREVRKAFRARDAAAPIEAQESMPSASQGGDGPPAVLVCSIGAGAIQAVDVKGLLRWAGERDCVLVFHHAVGDFVPSGAPLIEVFGDSRTPVEAAPDLRDKVALGIERTIEQDPAFAIRIMVDVAIRALSPAVNDPTTATQVLDHLAETLRIIGGTDLAQGSLHVDGQKRVRLVLPDRTWDDYLSLAVTEIRQYGASAIQVVRRLRALLEELLDTVRPEYRGAVEEELVRLDATVTENFGASVDLDRAGTGDPQGIGGPATSASRAIS